ncbi:MAG: 5'-nucleotidase C-terminal domain-containing protein [Anaerolineae bacterium]|nr:5'-nucleotidase C-terminal domain-containing protein [Thermoflexales bacterium]MDW8408354.1 5'-nucleotidase C-terminal domain-containing protein [Anaerolineae bacterium]
MKNHTPRIAVSVLSAVLISVATFAPTPAAAKQAPAKVISAPLAPTNAVADVTITRRASGLLNKPQVFEASVTPLTATLPITFTWQADEQPTQVAVVSGLTATAVFTWTVAGQKTITVTADNGAGSATRAISLTLSNNFNLTILHTNDVHARLMPYGVGGTSSCVDNVNSTQVCIAGAARLLTAIKQIRQQVDNSLLLDAGDQFQGTLFYNLFKSQPIAEVMNAMGYQAMAIGNHEFDDGPPELRNFIDDVNFPVISANIDASAEVSLAGKIAPSTIITVNGEPIGVVGLTTEDTAVIASPGPNVNFLARVPAMQQAVNNLLVQGIDRIIGLTHIGYADDLALAQTITGVDVIVGGHSHTFLRTPPTSIVVAPGATDTPAGPYPTVVTAPDGNPVLIVQAFQWGRYLGNLNVTFSPTGSVSAWSGNPIFMTNTIPLDPVITNILSPTYTGPVAALGNTVVGTTTVDMPLTQASVNICRRVECLLGNFVTDAMLWKVNQTLPISQHYQIALQNGGGLRASITALTVTVGEVIEVLPFGNTIATLELTGTHVITALENGLANVAGSGDGRFPQVGGLRYLWDFYRPVGSRVISVEVWHADTSSWLPLNPTARYRVVTNNFMRAGGDGYTVLRDFAINPYDFGPQLDQAAIEYLQQFSPITPVLQGRVLYTRRSALIPRLNILPANGISSTVLTLTLRNDLLSTLGGLTATVLTNKGALSSNVLTTAVSGATAGQAVVTLTAPLDAGLATIFAVGGGQIVSTTVQFYQDATTVNFTPSTITQSSGGVVQSGQIVTYTLTITNAGPGNASNVLLVGTIPNGTQYVSGSAVGGIGPGSLLAQQVGRMSPAAASSVVVWQGNVPVGGSHTMSYAVRVTALGGVITATSRVLLDNVEVNSVSASATVEPAARVFVPIVSR